MKTRREFLKLTGGTALGGLLASGAPTPAAPPAPTATPTKVPPTPTSALTAASAQPVTPTAVERGVLAKTLLPKPTDKRVVIIGGGVGGAMCARTLRKLVPDVEVVIVEKNPTYISGPYHVEYPVAFGDLAKATFSFDGLRRDGIKVLRAAAAEIRPGDHRVITSGGYIEYMTLVVATGIAMAESEIKGLEANAHLNPHAWDWERTVHLRQALQDFKGGVFVISVPPAPYKCPPGPYELACLAQEFWTNKGVKAEIAIVDANDRPQPVPLAEHWKKVLAERKITYKASFKVVEFDPQNQQVISDKGETQSHDLVSIIPPQKAPAFIQDSGLDYPFIDVDPTTFQSKKYPDIYALGDVTRVPYTKSAFTAFLQGGNAAYYIAKALGTDQGTPDPIFNQCWPYVSTQEAMLIEVAWDEEGKSIAERTKGEAPKADYAKQRKEWELGILRQAYG